jgi:outer membrane protein OmpA-like peptidoglycan-associated protein
MKHSSFLIHAFTAASVLGILCVSSITEAHAAESAGSVYQQASKPLASAENLEAYTLVKLNRVYFNYEASDLSTEEKIALNEVARRVSGTTQSVVELRGYSDGMESAQRGTVLATQRAQTIARYLTANGVAQERILLVASDGMNDEAKSMNPEHRRVDIRVFTAAGSGEADTHPGLASR